MVLLFDTIFVKLRTKTKNKLHKNIAKLEDEETKGRNRIHRNLPTNATNIENATTNEEMSE